ncbi:hypothetical protein ALNOE001_17140 [Candidatus Methanobinarius endosymbioticus]|uniref:Uncharacterized protein n=1 Tax=Candidatus Methanobinarius endosymbioticus TaxID=2006182 RepID=A0A366MA58_9EURY|nr:hypothetical protein ALNOE001_17140 [Candidatus Methanobinarius endosymbioticus]
MFHLNKQKMIDELEETEMELNYTYESRLSKVPAPTWFIHGPERIIKKELKILSRAKKLLAFVWAFFSMKKQIFQKFTKRVLKLIY